MNNDPKDVRGVAVEDNLCHIDEPGVGRAPPAFLGVTPPTQTTVPWATPSVSSQALTLISLSEKGSSFSVFPCPWTDVCAVAIAGLRPQQQHREDAARDEKQTAPQRRAINRIC
jgi:hypothetical protein